MKRLYNALMIIIPIVIITSCLSGPQQKLDDPVFYQKHGSWQFDKSAKQCFQASKKALSDMGFKIEKENKKKLSLISNRQPAVTYAEAIGSDSSIATQTKVYVKYYIKMEGDSKTCVVRIAKMKIYENLTEKEIYPLGFVKGRVDNFGKALKQAIVDQDF